MTQLAYEAFIAAPIADIYEYAANPRNWVEWYPGTREVEYAPEGLPRVGDEWEESIKIAGMWMRFTWRATEVESPRAWTIEGSARIQGPLKFAMDGGTATLRHRLEVKGERYQLPARDYVPHVKSDSEAGQSTCAEVQDGRGARRGSAVSQAYGRG